MGILDDILSPIRDIINGLEKPIATVERIFGEVINFTKQIIQSFIDMLDTLKDLFNASQVELMFLNPFKDAALTAVGSIEKLLAIASQAGVPTTDGLEDLIVGPIKLTYQAMRNNLGKMISTFGNLISEANARALAIPRGIASEFSRTKTMFASLEVDLKGIGAKIANEFSVASTPIYSVIPDFEDLGNVVTSNISGFVTTTGTSVRDDFTSIEQSVHRRFENENASVDFFYIAIFIMIIAVVGGLFMATRSIIAVIAVLVIIIIAFVFYMIFD